MKKASAVAAAVGLATASLVAISVSSPATAAVSGPLSFRGSTVVSALPTATATSTWSPKNEFAADREHSRGSVSPPSGGGTATVPSPHTTRVVSAGNSLVTSFQGLNHYDQRTANGGNQFSLEPPDQGLCVGGGNVIESVNTALKVYSTSGAAKSAVVDLNTFFKLPAEIDRSTGVAGPFLSDPKCYYDTETSRFFLTILEEDAAPSTNAYTLIAVSASNDPLGAWNIFWLNATDDGTGGTPSHPDCPCFGDQPLIGADHNGFYVTTNEFPAVANGFNGAQVYAMSKTALENGVVPAVQQFDNLPLAEGPAYSLQPATSPTANSFSWANRGTEYMLSALDFNGTVDNRIAVWALTNTSSLNTAHPAVTLTSKVISSENYGQPPVADQKNGDHPFGQWGANAIYGGAADQPVNTLNSNDDRMNQVVYVNGSLWAGLNTIVAQPGGATKAGPAWFRVGVDSGRGTRISARVEDQGYISVKDQNVLFPSIGVTPWGKAVLAVTLVGPGYFPSAAYAVNTGYGYGFGSLQVAGRGVGPADGFSGYDPFVSDGVERWGDYSAAVSTPGGTVWMANEYIAQSCTVAQFQLDTTCGGTRTTLANWSTRVSAVRP